MKTVKKFFKKNPLIQISKIGLQKKMYLDYNWNDGRNKLYRIILQLEKKGIVKVIRVTGQANKYIYIKKSERTNVSYQV